MRLYYKEKTGWGADITSITKKFTTLNISSLKCGRYTLHQLLCIIYLLFVAIKAAIPLCWRNICKVASF